MFIDGRLVIPDSEDLCLTLMTEAHDRLGYFKTIAELRRDFFWPKMWTPLSDLAPCVSGLRHQPLRQKA
jgi:hypothetical protein